MEQWSKLFLWGKWQATYASSNKSRNFSEHPGPKTSHIIVNGGDWLWSPENIKGANKDGKSYVERSTTGHNHYAHTLCMNYVTNTFLLVSLSVRSKQLLCFVHGQGKKSEQKHTTKKLVGFHNQPLYQLCSHQLNCWATYMFCYFFVFYSSHEET